MLDNLSASDTTAVTTKEQINSMIQSVNSMTVEDIFATITTMTSSFVIDLCIAIALYIVGKWVIGKIVGIMDKVMTKRKLDMSLSRFIISLTSISLTAILIFASIGVLGINTSSFLAVFASAGIAIGMALSGTLQNFAGGVMILFLKPYKIGDFIEAQGYTGTVKEISLFSTLLNTVDNKMIIIPNGPLSTGIINNFSKEDTRRVDFTFGVAYGTQYEKVEKVLLDIVNNHNKRLKDREVFIGLDNFGNSSVNFVMRVWVNSADYWDLYFDVNKKVYERFAQEGISIPYPQMDVHIKSK